MPEVIRIRNRRGELVDAALVSASDAKNGFGRILDRVAREGAIAITKHDEPCAVLISLDEYRGLLAAEGRVLDSLSGEFDALFARMQEPGAAEAMQRAFALDSVQLGQAAVSAARANAAQSHGGSVKRNAGAAAKAKRRARG